MDQLAVALGWTDWAALSAALRTVSQDQPGRRAPAEGAAPSATPKGATFSPALQASLDRSVALAAERKHGYNTIEHLLLALIDDPDAAAVMEACAVDRLVLGATLTRYIDEDLKQLLKMGDVENPPPTAGFHRVLQRATIHVQSAGRSEVTGANILVAIFSERESHACFFLQQQKLTRYDAVNFIAHGIRKGGAAA
jgi:ATP-dependent Clp protease ATP-binding subunit ClpA